jgi:peptide/nickel transport system permease protein
MEIVNAMPALIIVISIAALTGDPNIVVTMVVLGLLGWGEIYRFVRGQILSLREEDFVLAARSIGVTTRQIVLRHVLPNVIPYLIVQLAFSLPGAILTETSLSFLGLGVQEPTASWGNVVGAVRSLDNLEKRPWMWLPAGFLITLTVLCINFIGDALRDALDPRALIER